MVTFLEKREKREDSSLIHRITHRDMFGFMFFSIYSIMIKPRVISNNHVTWSVDVYFDPTAAIWRKSVAICSQKKQGRICYYYCYQTRFH